MKLMSWIKPILIGFPIGITFFDSIGYVAKVEGVSMQPTLNPEESSSPDIVYLCKLCTRNYNIDRGDIVSLISPKSPSERLIKRVIGLEGDVVYTKRYKKPVVRIPKGHCWIEGDNSERSMDSNEFGPIAAGLITARASMVLWPPKRWRFLTAADYEENSGELYVY